MSKKKTFSWHLLSRKRARDGVFCQSFGWSWGFRKWHGTEDSLEKRRCATVLDEDYFDVGWALARLAFPFLFLPTRPLLPIPYRGEKGNWLTDECAFSDW